MPANLLTNCNVVVENFIARLPPDSRQYRHKLMKQVQHSCAHPPIFLPMSIL